MGPMKSLSFLSIEALTRSRNEDFVCLFLFCLFNQNELRIQYLYKEKGYAKYENTCMTSFKLSA